VGVRSILLAVFGARVSHLKFSVPGEPGLRRGRATALAPVNSDLKATIFRDFGNRVAAILIEVSRAPQNAGSFGLLIAEPLDADAAGRRTFYRALTEWGREGERDGHIDLPNASLLAGAKLPSTVVYSTETKPSRHT